MFIIKFFLVMAVAVVLLVVFVAASIVFRFWGLFRSIVNGTRQAQTGRTSAFNQNSNNTSETTSSSSPSGNKKIFAPEEGEYVDFEEIP